MKLIKMYFAGPLFSESERNWIRATISRIKALAAELNAPVEIVWPFELFSPGELDALGDRAQHEVFIRCREHVHAADMLIALLCCSMVPRWMTARRGRSSISTPSVRRAP